MRRREGGQRRRTKSPNSSERGAFNGMEAISEEFSRSGQDLEKRVVQTPADTAVGLNSPITLRW